MFDENEPLRRLTVDLVIDGKVVGSTIADVIRRDLDKKLHPDRHVGYHTFLPLELWTGDAYELSIVVRETGTELAHQRLKTTNFRIPGPAKITQGQLTGVGPRRISGWVSDGGAPLDIAIEIDGHRVHEGLADDESQMVGLTPAGFDVELPAPFFDGRSHHVAAYVSNTAGRFPLGTQDVVLAARDAPRIDCHVEAVTGSEVQGRAIDLNQPDHPLVLALDIDGREATRTTSQPQEHGRFTLALAAAEIDPFGSALTIRTVPGAVSMDVDWPRRLREASTITALRQPGGPIDLTLHSTLVLPPVVSARISAPGLAREVEMRAPEGGETLRTVRLMRVPEPLERLTITCGLLREEIDILSPDAFPGPAQVRQDVGAYLPPHHADVTRRLGELANGVPDEAGDPRRPAFSGAWTIVDQSHVRGWVVDLSRPAAPFIVRIRLDGVVVGQCRTGLTGQGAPVTDAACGFFFDLKTAHRPGPHLVTVQLAEGIALPPEGPLPVELVDGPADFEAMADLRATLVAAAQDAPPPGTTPALDDEGARRLSRLLLGIDAPEGLTGLAVDAALLALLRDDRFQYDVLPRLARSPGRSASPLDVEAGVVGDVGALTSLLSLPDAMRMAMAAAGSRRDMLKAFLSSPLPARVLDTEDVADWLTFRRITTFVSDTPEAGADLRIRRRPDGSILIAGLPILSATALALEFYDPEGGPLARRWLDVTAGQTSLTLPGEDTVLTDAALVAIALPGTETRDDTWVIRPVTREPVETTATAETAQATERLARAEALFAAGDYASVIETASGTGRPARQLRLRAMRELGHLADALALARRLVSEDPDDRESLLLLLRLRRDMADYPTGLAEAAQVAGTFGRFADFRELCRTLFRKWLEGLASTSVETDCRPFMEAFRREVPALLDVFRQDIGRIASPHATARDHAAVIALLEPLAPYLDNDSRTSLAASLRAVKRLGEARSLATTSLAADPDDMRAVRVLRDVALDERNFAEAFHLNAITLTRKAGFDNLLTQARIYVALANNGFGAGHYLNPIPPAHAYAAGLQLLERLVKDYPKDYRGWWTLGQIYQHARRYASALHAFETADTLRPTDAHALGIARLHMREGDFEQAKAACRLALERNPDNVGATYTLQYLNGPDFAETTPPPAQVPSVTVFDTTGLAVDAMAASVDRLYGITLRSVPAQDRAAPDLGLLLVDAGRAAPEDWFVLPLGDGVVAEDFAAFAFAGRERLGAVFSPIAVGHFTSQAFIRGGLMAEIVEASPPGLSPAALAERIQAEARRLLRTNLADNGGRSMSVAIVSRHGWLGFGGAEQFMRNIARAYAEAGYEVWIVGISPGLADQQGEEDGIRWCFVEDQNGLRRLLMEKRFGAVHATGLVYDVAKAASFLNITIVYGFHFFRDLIESLSADDGYYPRITDDWPARPEGKALLRELSVLYANSRFSRKLIEAKFRIRVPVIYSTSYEAPALAEGRGEVILLMNARADKGFAMLLEMAERLPHRQFVAVANQSSGVMAQRWLQLRGLANVTILERTDDIDALYARARVVIVPSFEFVETFSRVVIEAQSRGRVVIGAEAGNIPYLLAESGFLLPEDPARWAETAESLFTDPALYEQAREKALANTRHFDAPVFRAQAGRAIASLKQRILVGVGAGIGNIIHTTPLLRLIARHFGTPVDVVLSEGGTNYFDVLDNTGVVGSIMELGPLALSRPYDLVFLTNCFGDLAPAFNTPKQIVSRAYDRFVPGQSPHETVFNLEMGERLLGLSWTEEDAHAYFFGDLVYRPPNAGIIAFHGGSKGGRWEAKRWPHYPRLAEALVADGYRVVSLGIPEEYVPGTEDWTGGTVGEMADRLLQVDYLVSNDSGVMNIGNALGVPLTAIFAPTEAATRGPRRPTSHIVALRKDCSPCEVKDSAHFNAGLCRCIGEIGLDEVLASVRAGLAATRKHG